MPLTRCTRNGSPGYKGGPEPEFKCYTYRPNDPTSREHAKNQALQQLRAVKANQEK